jgi:hypothetical protein
VTHSLDWVIVSLSGIRDHLQDGTGRWQSEVLCPQVLVDPGCRTHPAVFCIVFLLFGVAGISNRFPAG